MATRKLRESGFNDPIYGIPYTLLVGDRALVAPWCEKRWGVPPPDTAGVPDATTIVVGGCKGTEIVFWFRPDPKKGASENAALVAHEALHATASVMRDIGMPIESASEEAWAYYIQFLTANLLERLRSIAAWRKVL